MPRLLLIANENARAVGGYRREVILRALSAEFAVDVAHTEEPGHAVELALRAANAAMDVVVALGGDGTVNEVANGLAGSGVRMGILPAGGVNVFARSLGIPGDAVEATGLLLERLRRPPRRVPLGRADGRYFLVSCGVGFDAAIVRDVERRQEVKRATGDWFFVWTGLRLFFSGYGHRRARLQVAWGDGDHERRDGLRLAIVQNTGPYVYWGRRAMRLSPEASLAGGLDCFALDTMRTSAVLRTMASAFRTGRHVGSRHVLSLHDLRRLEIAADEPMPVQVDGEYLGLRDRLTLRSVPDALSVLA